MHILYKIMLYAYIAVCRVFNRIREYTRFREPPEHLEEGISVILIFTPDIVFHHV